MPKATVEKPVNDASKDAQKEKDARFGAILLLINWYTSVINTTGNTPFHKPLRPLWAKWYNGKREQSFVEWLSVEAQEYDDQCQAILKVDRGIDMKAAEVERLFGDDMPQNVWKLFRWLGNIAKVTNQKTFKVLVEGVSNQRIVQRLMD